ncbi:MAG: glycoside hydrolase family 76 protein [Rhodococcus sp. (in: high G+C Gram-positive bacteria)]
MHDTWSSRADAAEEAVISRHVRRLWGLPGTALGVVAWPPVRRERLFFRWHYWWQAHLIDCVVDAEERAPTAKRRRRLVRIARAHRLRNITGWTNSYYDDMAWLGLSLERAQRLHLIDNRDAISALEQQLFDAWDPGSGGGIRWSTKSDFFNVPSNGPASVLLARTGKLWRAQAMADWIDATLIDPETKLVYDGIHSDGAHLEGRIETPIYSYCQGVVLGAETELAVRLGDRKHNERVNRLVRAVQNHLTVDGVISGSGGGDGGLFNGILGRYLALVATSLPGDTDDDHEARSTAADIVLRSAEAAWENCLSIEGLPLFGSDWSRIAALPSFGAPIARFSAGTVTSSSVPERDFSVQLGGWMLMEAAHSVTAGF